MGNRIKELRLENGISQEELSKAIGVTRQAISLFEKGKRDPKLETWVKLADYFNVSIEYLQGQTDEKSIYIEFYKVTTNERYTEKMNKILNNLKKNMTEKEWKEFINLETKISVTYSLLDTKTKNDLEQDLKKLIEKYTKLATDTSNDDHDTKD